MAGGMVVADVGGRARDYNGKVTWYVILVALIASSGGLLFGYDLGVTGGVESFPNFLAIFFPEVALAQAADTSADPYCSYASQKLSAFTSVLFLSGESKTCLFGLHALEVCTQLGLLKLYLSIQPRQWLTVLSITTNLCQRGLLRAILAVSCIL